MHLCSERFTRKINFDIEATMEFKVMYHLSMLAVLQP